MEVGLTSRALEASSPAKDTLTYEPFFGLAGKAFSLNSDPRFVYTSPSYGTTRDGLRAGIRRREGLHVLTGEIGAGKTTLCQDVIRDLGGKTYSAMVRDPFASREDLLKTMLIDFGVLSIQELTSGHLRQASRTELGYLLSEFIDSLVHDAFVVVIIDEAQNLSLPLIEETRILADTFGAAGRLQIVFVGQPELHAKLKLPEMRQVDQRVCGYHRLAPMSLDAVHGYIQHRLHMAGGRRDRVLFPDEIVGRLHARCGGVPRLINRVCDRALQLAYEGKAESVDREILETALLEIGSATLLPTWDSIVFAEAQPVAAIAAVPVVAPARAASPVVEPTPPPATPAVEPAVEFDDSDDFDEQIDQWVAKDLATPSRKPLHMMFAEDVLPLPAPPPSASRAIPKSDARSRIVTSEWTQDEGQVATPRIWPKRIVATIAVLIALSLGGVGAAIWVDTQSAPMTPVVAEQATTLEGANAIVKTPVAEAPPAEVPVTAASVAVEPTVAAPLVAAPLSAAASEEYLVAVGLFSSRARAGQLVDALTQAGLPALQRPSQFRGQGVQQIVLGPYFSRADAAADLQRLKALGGYDDASMIDSARQP